MGDDEKMKDKPPVITQEWLNKQLELDEYCSGKVCTDCGFEHKCVYSLSDSKPEDIKKLLQEMIDKDKQPITQVEFDGLTKEQRYAKHLKEYCMGRACNACNLEGINGCFTKNSSGGRHNPTGWSLIMSREEVVTKVEKVIF